MRAGHREGYVTVRRSTERRTAELWALVLSSRGIESVIERDGESISLMVAPADAARAVYELTEHDLENLPPPGERPLGQDLPRLEPVMAYWAAMLFFFAAARREAFGIDWLAAGAARADAMLAGEWWRAVTALSLHVDAAHLLGNLAFGTVFALLLARVTGSGLAWLAMIAAGALGNALNALIQPAAHASIGASTAIFAAVGLLAALNQAGRPWRLATGPRAAAPLAGGIMLLAFLGFAGERTDVLAHVLGFVTGLAAGWLMARRWTSGPAGRIVQRRAAIASLGILAAAWTAALAA